MSHLCKASDGHLKKRASGHLANGCPTVAPCANCSAGTPRSYTLTATGITLCGGGWIGTLNGTFTLPPDAAGCFYILELPGVSESGVQVNWSIAVISASSLRVQGSRDDGVRIVFNAGLAKTTNHCDETLSGSNTLTGCGFGAGGDGSVTVTPNF